MQEEEKTKRLKTPPTVLVRVVKGEARERERRFTDIFLIGRQKDCDVQLLDSCVSRVHAKVLFDGERWWIKDLESANGTFLEGARIQNIPLPDEVEFELGKGGPILSLRVEKPLAIDKKKKAFTSETQVIQQFFDKRPEEKIGVQTMMFRRAFERVYKKRSRKYWVIIGISIFLLLSSGSVIIYQKNKLNKLKNTAVDIFYTMKSLELQIAKLEEIVMLKADPKQIQELRAKRQQLKSMERNYDQFVKELGLYRKMRQEDRIIFQIARLFGECDVKVPKGFVEEVWNYIRKWKATDRLEKALSRSKSEGYVSIITQTMTDNNLPPHFFYLALQESDFEARAVGPKTKYGYAKGIWQFIPMTAEHYGLKIGPLYNQKMYDPKDERFYFEKATSAAARYLKDIHNSLAQASGLLVIASYNWGATRIKEILREMPENPRERNFWCLLEKRNIPQETYDYVLYIVSATVICENPRLFGFDFDSPLQ
jgi:membrane-bound lytic murein transglycosylase D